MKTTLLLDKVHQPLVFVSFRRLAKMMAKDKVEIIAVWDNIFLYGNVPLPATVRLKDYVRKRPILPRFSRRGIFKRDNFTCQFTGEILPPTQLTVDHVIPRSKGGKSSWDNCVTCSLEANAKKGDNTPEEAGMKLLRKPGIPAHPLAIDFSLLEYQHENWKSYFPS